MQLLKTYSNDTENLKYSKIPILVNLKPDGSQNPVMLLPGGAGGRASQVNVIYHNQIPGRASLPCRLCGTASHPAGHGYYSAESSVRLGQGAKSPNPG